MKRTLLIVIIVGLLFAACSRQEELFPPMARGEIISFTFKGSLSVDEIIANAEMVAKVDSFATYGADYYEVTYRTQFQERPINSKALIILPQGATSCPLITYFHGTMIPLSIFNLNKGVPSNFDGKDKNATDIFNITLPWVSAGYAVVMPDYIGYGLTSDEEHPYMYYPEMFVSNVDAIFAAKQFIKEQTLVDTKDVFLTGWSEGGGACLSAQRYIEEQYSDRLNVVASSSLAGPHNMIGFLDNIIQQDINSDLPILIVASWVVYSLNKFSGLQRPTDQIFAYPVYDQNSAFFVPSYKLKDVFNPYFLEKIRTGEDTQLRGIFEECVMHKGWRPKGKVFLHHGEKDNVVYPFNSKDAYEGLTQTGGDITLYLYPDGDHASELGNYSQQTLIDFNTLK